MGRRHRVPFRYAWTRWVQVGFWAFVFACLFGALFAAVEGGVLFLIMQRVACTLGCVALAWLIVRLARMGIFIADDMVEFRNVFRTERIAWSEIVAFEPPPSYGTWRKPGLRARLTNGSVLSASAVQLGPFEGPRAAQDVVDRLNALLAQHR